MTRTRAVLLSPLLGLLLADAAYADEGQWMPEQISSLDRQQLENMGLAIEPQALWTDDGGLMRAAVSLSGCSAAFISAEGLVATNHHCAYSALQAASTVEHDVLSDGFLARTRDQEIEAKGRTVRVLDQISDVTAEVRKVIDEAHDDAERSRAAERVQKRLVEACEKVDPAYRCQVAGFYNGSEYRLFRSMELRDIRIVYAPPSAIGEYGGEIDNWMWPRHTGDFTLLRAYTAPDGKPADHSAENIPFRPAQWLTVGAEGVKPGDFVAVLGYPGKTNRYLPAPEVERHLDQILPARVDLYGEWIALLEEMSRRDEVVRIKVAADLKSLANRHKNARGMIDGLRRMALLDRRKQEDERLADWVSAQGEKRFANVLVGLEQLSRERRDGHPRAMLLAHLDQPDGLAIALDLVRRAREQKKSDLERSARYMDRNRQDLWRSIDRHIRDFDSRVDRALLESIVRREKMLPEHDRFLPPALDADKLVRRTELSDPARVRSLFDAADEAALARSRDPLIMLAMQLVPHVEAEEEADRVRGGKELVLGPRYFEMLRSMRQGPVYPDANGTLRFSYAKVTGYRPQEGLVAEPQTTLAGAMLKHTGQTPFRLPDTVIAKAAAAKQTFWADPELGDLPVCFLASGDTTGGNSGSPVIDGHGRFVGLNFDRVWENIAGDFGYNPERSRNVVVDVRYLLWLLDEVMDAGELLTELGVAALRDAPPRSSPNPVPAANLLAHAAGLDGESAPGCACATHPGISTHPWLGVLVLTGIRRRQRGRFCPPVRHPVVVVVADPVSSSPVQ